MKKIKSFFSGRTKTLGALTLVVALITLLLTFRLGSLTNDYLAITELNLINQSSSWRLLLENPLYLGLKLPLLLLNTLGINSIVIFRLVPAAFGFLSALLFFSAIRLWYTRRVAALGSILFITSSWFLHNARLIDPAILYPFALILLCVLAFWLPRTEKHKIALFLGVLAAVFMMYTPGFALLLIPIAIWRAPKLQKIFARTPVWYSFAMGALFIGLLAPLIMALFSGTVSLTQAFALPRVFEPLEWLKRLLVEPVYLFARGPFDPIRNLDRLPLLDIFSSVLLILGVYVYSFRTKLDKVRLLAFSAIGAAVVIALNSPAILVWLMPVCYLFITAGIALLLQQWFTVFPKNPLARSVGIILLVMALGSISFYHLKRYYVAWPNNSETDKVFVGRLPS